MNKNSILFKILHRYFGNRYDAEQLIKRIKRIAERLGNFLDFIKYPFLRIRCIFRKHRWLVRGDFPNCYTHIPGRTVYTRSNDPDRRVIMEGGVSLFNPFGRVEVKCVECGFEGLVNASTYHSGIRVGKLETLEDMMERWGRKKIEQQMQEDSLARAMATPFCASCMVIVAENTSSCQKCGSINLSTVGECLPRIKAAQQERDAEKRRKDEKCKGQTNYTIT